MGKGNMGLMAKIQGKGTGLILPMGEGNVIKQEDIIKKLTEDLDGAADNANNDDNNNKKPEEVVKKKAKKKGAAKKNNNDKIETDNNNNNHLNTVSEETSEELVINGTFATQFKYIMKEGKKIIVTKLKKREKTEDEIKKDDKIAQKLEIYERKQEALLSKQNEKLAIVFEKEIIACEKEKNVNKLKIIKAKHNMILWQRKMEKKMKYQIEKRKIIKLVHSSDGNNEIRNNLIRNEKDTLLYRVRHHPKVIQMEKKYKEYKRLKRLSDDNKLGKDDYRYVAKPYPDEIKDEEVTFHVNVPLWLQLYQFTKKKPKPTEYDSDYESDNDADIELGIIATHDKVTGKRNRAKKFGFDAGKKEKPPQRISQDFLLKRSLREMYDVEEDPSYARANLFRSNVVSSDRIPWIAHNYHGSVTSKSLEKRQIIGEGGTSFVRMALLVDVNHFVALKTVKKKYVHENITHLKAVIQEKDNHKKVCNHPFIIDLFCTTQDKKNIYFVQQLGYGGELRRLISFHGHFKPNVAKFFAVEMLLAIEFIHLHGIVHRDITSENFVLDEYGHIQLTDFGNSRRPNKAGFCFTPVGHHMNAMPSLLNGLYKDGYSGQHADIWAWACVFFEMLTGHNPFTKNHKLAMVGIYKRQCENILLWPKSRIVHKKAKSLLMELLLFDEEDRIKNIQEVKLDPFFSDTDWGKALDKQYIPPFKIKGNAIPGKSSHFPFIQDLENRNQVDSVDLGPVPGF